MNNLKIVVKGIDLLYSKIDVMILAKTMLDTTKLQLYVQVLNLDKIKALRPFTPVLQIKQTTKINSSNSLCKGLWTIKAEFWGLLLPCC